MSDNPLGLPKGSIRAIITIIAFAAVIIGSLLERYALVELFSPVLALIVGFYFGSRQKEGGN